MTRRVLKFLLLALLPALGWGSCAAQSHLDSLRVDSLVTQLTANSMDIGVTLLIDLSLAYKAVDPGKGVKYGQDALALAETTKDKPNMANASRAIGTNFQALSDPTQALNYFLKALALSPAEDTAKVKLLGDISYLFNAMDPAAGIKYGTQELALAQKLRYKQGMADAYGKLGVNSLSLSDYTTALEYHFAALKINEELQDKMHIAGNLGNIGNIYSNQGDYDKALEYYFKILKIFEAQNSKGNIALTTGNIAGMYVNKGDYTRALEYSFKALKMDQELGREFGIATNMFHIASVYTSQRNYQTALEYYFKTLEMYERQGDKHSATVTLGNIGECYLAIARDTGRVPASSLIPAGKYEVLKKATEYTKRGIALSKELGDLADLQAMSQNFSDEQALLGDYAGALESFKISEALNDSLFGQEIKEKIINLDTKREIELKNKQIEIDKLDLTKKHSERNYFIAGIALLLLVILFILRNYYLQKRSNERISKEKQRNEELLLNILPAEVADELKINGTAQAMHFDNVTVMFTDFASFTQAGERMPPQELVDELHACFKAFDEIITKYGIEKIKTIGDSYLAVCGMPVTDARHAEHIVAAAIEINEFMLNRRAQLKDKTFELRTGIHSGSVVAGIVGVKKFAYDIWGDTVNTAARMEAHGGKGKINISQMTYELVKGKFDCVYRGEIEAKNKGVMKMYFVSDKTTKATLNG